MIEKNKDFIDFMYTLCTSVVLRNKYRYAHTYHTLVLRTLFCYMCQNTVTIIRSQRFSARLYKSEPQTNPAARTDL